MTEEMKRHLSAIGRKGGQAGRGTAAATLRGRKAGKESYFQRLFKELQKHDDLIAVLCSECPGILDGVETDEELMPRLEAAFRASPTYLAKVKSLMPRIGQRPEGTPNTAAPPNPLPPGVARLAALGKSAPPNPTSLVDPAGMRAKLDASPAMQALLACRAERP
jgi:hypothetical protein